MIEETAGVSINLCPSSTDCNIPLSMGIPAVCIGVYEGAGMHTQEEYLELDSLPTGLEISAKVLCKLTQAEINE